MQNNHRPPLWTADFILVFASNLLMFFSFYMLVPILPFYLLENLGTSRSTAGIVLSLYTIAALFIRPFSGFLVDSFSRKPLYLICYGFFSIIFAGYVVATMLFFFIILRILHGFAFGINTVSGSTVAVDIMPSERRGEGIGYYGMAASVAMAVGPVMGLWLYKNYTFDVIFLAAFSASIIGFITILFIKPIKKEHSGTIDKMTLSWDRFILLKALPCVALLFLMGFGYGAVSNFIGLYSGQVSYDGNAGIFFIILSVGILLARLLSARVINDGKVVRTIYVGSALLILAFGLFVVCDNPVLYYIIALLLGAGYGHINPAFQSMFISLSKHNQRGTANATYFTFWDMGIGLGIAVGGYIIEKLDFGWMFGLSSTLIIIGTVYFALVSSSYYRKNKLV
ncbi:MFS transporter [Dysgonomonas macrotermitis]|uniref:Predicted arabinose efflux permease, MFS family n=1 Tax=Dysgonomonas macrotermitis TaxID=1346286 RepID=A0A1M5CLK6_9BACT|nr:MFS transporter [Dysgonomonas macrotermitis]SHF55477.1 Predicted arabinose efflux permease, MFS family [Dysgonomonas macrotermitis]